MGPVASNRVRPRTLDLDLAAAALDWFSHNVPAEDRSEDGPFAAPVPVSDDADPYTRLAAYVGRSALTIT